MNIEENPQRDLIERLLGEYNQRKEKIRDTKYDKDHEQYQAFEELYQEYIDKLTFAQSQPVSLPNGINRDELRRLIAKKLQSAGIDNIKLESELADALLPLLHKTETVEDMIAKLPVGEYTISPPLIKEQEAKEGNKHLWHIDTNDDTFEGKTLTEAITNYYNEITK